MITLIGREEWWYIYAWVCIYIRLMHEEHTIPCMYYVNVAQCVHVLHSLSLPALSPTFFLTVNQAWILLWECQAPSWKPNSSSSLIALGSGTNATSLEDVAGLKNGFRLNSMLDLVKRSTLWRPFVFRFPR